MASSTNLELVINNLCNEVSKVPSADSSPLQRIKSCFDVVIAMTRPDCVLTIFQCQMGKQFVDCVQSLLINLICGCSQPNPKDYMLLYWYYCCLDSCYACFTSLRVSKLVVIDPKYYETVLNVTATSLKNLHNKQTEANNLLIRLFRILYICQQHLPPHLSLIDAVTPYFKHEDYCVEVASRNTAHFLIPYISKSQEQLFVLTQKNLHDILFVIGKAKNVHDSLALLLAYGLLPVNCKLYLEEGVFLYAMTIAFKSSDLQEKTMAFALMQKLNSIQTASIASKGVTENMESCSTSKRFVERSNDTAHHPESSEFVYLVSELNAQVTCFKKSNERNEFEHIQDILNQLDSLSIPQLSNEASSHLNTLVLNILVDVTEALTVVTEYHIFKWYNDIFKRVWILLKSLENCSKNPSSLSLEDINHFIDNMLQAIHSLVDRDIINEITSLTICHCLKTLEEIFYGNISLEFDLKTLPLSSFKKALLESKILTLLQLKEKVQTILAYLVTEEDSEIMRELCIRKDILAKCVEECSQLSEIRPLTVALRKFKAFSEVSENRFKFRQLGLLEVLENLSEKYPDSQVDMLSAELIYLLLSDQPDIIEEYPSFDEIELSESHCIAMEEFVQCLGNAIPAESLDVYRHVQSLYSLMVVSSIEYGRVTSDVNKKLDLQSVCTYFAKHLKELLCIYENMKEPNVLSHIESQVSSISKTYLPHFVSILLKVKKVYASTQSQDNLFGGLMSLVFSCLENWSRMGNSVKRALVKYGACHLLLNELYGDHAQNFKNAFTILLCLYNIMFELEFVSHFQLVYGDNLLEYFLSNNDVRIRCLAKFCLSCLHMFLLPSETNQLSLLPDEAELVGTCLKDSTHLFGEISQLQLVATIENLAFCPKNWDIFRDTEVVHTLVELATTETGSIQNHSLSALINMCPFQGDVTSVSVSTLLQSMPQFLKFISTSNLETCTGFHCLFQLQDEAGLNCAKILYNHKRYNDCEKLCKSLNRHQDSEVQLYMAKSMYHQYKIEFIENIKQRKTIPPFEYKAIMRSFCNDRIIEVIRILTKLRPLMTNDLWDSEATYILDKALIDCLIFNIDKVKTCLLCHIKADKLIRSHYISKFILQRSVKAMGCHTSENVVMFSPTDQPSDWQLKSAAKITYSMLCKRCDGEILSQDENAFKKCVFDLFYEHENSQMLALSISYDAFFHRFTAGLIFRGMAQFCSSVCAEIGQFDHIHILMQACREACLLNSYPPSSLKFYMLPLPSEFPPGMEKPLGWDAFVGLANAPYGAYRLLQPGEPTLPKRLYCFMVKAGVMLFVASLDRDLDEELDAVCSEYRIQLPPNESDTCTMNIPEDSKRADLIPQMIWWSLLDWAQEKTNAAMSVTILLSPSVKFMAGHGLTSVIQQASEQSEAFYDTLSLKNSPVIANLLPPGFEINFDKIDTPQEKMVNVPSGHKVLLHSFFTVMFEAAAGYVIFARHESNTPPEKKEKCSVYSRILQPYILMYVTLSQIVFKLGFLIDEWDYRVKGILPGCRTEMKDSIHLKQLIERIPEIIRQTLRAKGFRSFKSLLFWGEHLKNVKTNERVTPSLDSTCFHSEKCFYCRKLCNVCMNPCHPDEQKTKEYSDFGIAHCCSDSCYNFLSSGTSKVIIEKIPDHLAMLNTSEGHFEYLRGYISIIDHKHFDFQSTVFFSICQSGKEMGGYFTVPSELKYVRLWYWNIYKPICIEYVVDNDFNPVKLLDFQHCGSVFSQAEEIQLMLEYHEILVVGQVPYHFMKCQFC